MDNRKFMIFLAIILVMQIFTWSNTRQLHQEIEQLQHRLRSMESEVSSGMSATRSIVEQIRQDANWWSFTNDIEVISIDQDKTKIKVSWMVKEQNQGEQIDLHYMLAQDTAYRSIVAEQDGKGGYSAILEVDTPNEPPINIGIGGHIGNMGWGQAYDSAGIFQLEYYITRDDGDRVLSSETKSLDLTKIAFQLFEQLDVSIFADENENLSAMLQVFPYDRQTPFYTLESIFLENRDANGRVLQHWQFAADDSRGDAPQISSDTFNNEFPRTYRVEATSLQEIQSLYLVVEYNEGLRYEQKVSGN